jgi:uncharacterized protein YhfF
VVTIEGLAGLRPGPERPSEAELASFWERVKAARREVELPDHFDIRWLGSNAEDTEETFEHLVTGAKNGACRVPPLLKAKGQQMSRIGDVSVLIDFKGSPRLALRYIKSEEVVFSQVTKENVSYEGYPRLRDPEAWKKQHQADWERELAPFGLKFSTDMKIVIQRFEVIYYEDVRK